MKVHITFPKVYNGGAKLTVIKIIRELTGGSLVDAKEMSERSNTTLIASGMTAMQLFDLKDAGCGVVIEEELTPRQQIHDKLAEAAKFAIDNGEIAMARSILELMA